MLRKDPANQALERRRRLEPGGVGVAEGYAARGADPRRRSSTAGTARRATAWTGKGDGPAGKNLPGLSKMDPMMPNGPADFTDPAQRLAESDAFLQGKMLRGGMGTGMPEFGSLYTDEELWAMVSYVRSFLFDR